jgi:hypothetical protein
VAPISPPVAVVSFREQARELALLWSFVALIVLGRVVCVIVQACIQLCPYDVPGEALHRHGIR